MMPGTLLIFLLQALANICCRDDGKEIGKGESGVRVRKSKHQGDWMPVDRDQHKDALLAKQQCVRHAGMDLRGLVRFRRPSGDGQQTLSNMGDNLLRDKLRPFSVVVT